MPARAKVNDVIVEQASAGARLLTARGAGARIISVASNLALVALVTPADLGLLAVVRGLTGLTGNTSDLGFAWALLRRRHTPSDEEYGALVGIQLTLVTLFVGMIVAVPGLLETVGAVPPTWRVAMVLVLLTMFTVPAGTSARIRIERQLDYRRISFADVSSVLFQNLALLAFAVSGRFAMGVFVATGISVLYSNLLLCFWSPGPGPSFRWSLWRRLGREFAGFSAGHLGSLLNNSATPLVIANLFGLSAAGIWSLATRLGNVLQLAFEGFRRAAVPAAALLANIPTDLRRLARESLFGAARYGVPLIAAMYAGLPVLGWLLPKWAPAVRVAQLYILGFGVTGVIGASFVPVAVAVSGARVVVAEQFAPLLVGWAAFAGLALAHSTDITWAVPPMYVALLVAVWRSTPVAVRPPLSLETRRLFVALAATVALVTLAQLFQVHPLPTAVVATLLFAVTGMARRPWLVLEAAGVERS